MAVVRANGVSLSLLDEGESEAPLVLLHGVLGSGRFFDELVRRLAPRHRVVVPDLRGHGDSEKVLSGHTVPTYARDVAALLETLRVERPVLVGWSMGAMVAYELLGERGRDSVAGLVIVDQPPADFAWGGDYRFGLFGPEVLAEAIDGIQTHLPAVAHEWAELMLHEPTPDAVAFFVEQFVKVPPAIGVSILVDQTLRDYRGFIPTIDVPTLVAFGADPKATDPEAGRWIADAIAGSRFELFERSSHAPFFEEPDAFARVLEDFAGSL